MSSPESVTQTHERAFNIFCREKRLADVAKELNQPYSLIVKWSSAKYCCAENCPWHGWEQLAENKAKAFKAVIEAQDNGNISPRDEQTAVQGALSKTIRNDKVEAVKKVLRSDFERLQHLEFLYAKVFFDATGIALPMPNISLPEGAGDQVVEKLYEMGKHASSMKECIGLLQTLKNEIDKIKTAHNLHETASVRKETPGEVRVSIQELRELRAKLDHTPRDGILQVINGNGHSRPASG